MRDIREALVEAVSLCEESQRQRQESAALRGWLRKQRVKSRTLTWQARECRAIVTYSRLLARVRGPAPGATASGREAEKPDTDHLREENQGLASRILDLEARILNLVEERGALFDALDRYLEMQRSIVKTRS